MKKLLLIFSAIACASLFAACGEKGPIPPPDEEDPPGEIVVSGVELDAGSACISPLESLTLTATVLPEEAKNREITWSSSDNGVATVSNGVVTPVAYGTATITVTTAEGGKTAACDVTVNLIGTVSFRTEKTWKVGSQEWSDVVMATGARKTTFDGGYYVNMGDYEFKADCRENPGYGDCFSWTAIAEYKEQLCPAPWRIPVKNDFATLDIALGGTGEGSARIDEATMANYMNPARWGGQFGGFAYADQIWNIEEGSYYATQTEVVSALNPVPTYAYVLFLRNGTNHVRPAGNEPMFNGWPVRCVK